MRVLVFGASGQTGRLFCERALDAGHEVTAFVRDPDKLGLEHERLSVARGDVLDPGSLDAAMPGHDAVVYAVGAPHDDRANPGPADGMENVVASMKRHDVPLVLTVSAWGVADSAEKTPLVFRRVVMPLMFKKAFAVKARMEDAVRGSGLDYVIARPMRLKDGEPQGYRASLDGKGVKQSVPRADLAAFLLAELDEPRHRGAAPAVGVAR